MWRLSNHGSDREESVDKTLDAPRHKKKSENPFFPLPFTSPSQEKPSTRSWGLCRWQPHALAGWAPVWTFLHFSSALLRFCSSPSSRCEATSGPAVLLPGTQHSCGKVRIGPFCTQREAREPKRSPGKAMSSMKLIIKSFRPSGCTHNPGKGSLPQITGLAVRAEGTQHPTGCIQHLSGSTYSAGLPDRAGRRHYVSQSCW